MLPLRPTDASTEATEALPQINILAPGLVTEALPGRAEYLGYLASTSVEYLGYKSFILFNNSDTSASAVAVSVIPAAALK